MIQELQRAVCEKDVTAVRERLHLCDDEELRSVRERVRNDADWQGEVERLAVLGLVHEELHRRSCVAKSWGNPQHSLEDAIAREEVENARRRLAEVVLPWARGRMIETFMDISPMGPAQAAEYAWLAYPADVVIPMVAREDAAKLGLAVSSS